VATIDQYPLAAALVCPYTDCNSVLIEKIDGVSEGSFSFPLDSNKVTIRYRCKKCNRIFVFYYYFGLDSK
jgi:hypothetical protein